MKAKKIFAVLCACAIAMFAFTACGSNDNETTEATTAEASTTDTTSENTTGIVGESDNTTETVSFSGTYSPATITDSEGSEMTYDEYVSQAAIAQGYEEGSEDYDSFIASNKATYVFNEDGTVKATMGEEENNGTYEFDGDATVTTTFDGVSTEYKFDADKNTLTATDSDSGITIVMSKA